MEIIDYIPAKEKEPFLSYDKREIEDFPLTSLVISYKPNKFIVLYMLVICFLILIPAVFDIFLIIIKMILKIIQKGLEKVLMKVLALSAVVSIIFLVFVIIKSGKWAEFYETLLSFL